MADFIEDQRLPIEYLPKYREYYIPLIKGHKAIQCILFCPWCGTKLPKDLGNEYFDILEKEYNITSLEETEKAKSLPEEFKTDEWWKKRGF